MIVSDDHVDSEPESAATPPGFEPDASPLRNGMPPDWNAAREPVPDLLARGCRYDQL